MKEVKHNNSQSPSLKHLVFAISFAALAIITSIFTIIVEKNRTNFLFPIILALLSLLFTITSLGVNEIGSFPQQLFITIRKSRLFAFLDILGESVKKLVILLILLASLGLGSLGFGYITHTLSSIIIGSLILLLTLLLSSVFYTLLQEKVTPVLNPPFPSQITRSPQDEEFVILSSKITYEYLSDGITMYQRKRLRVQAVKSGLTHFTHKYRWTGSGKCNVKVLRRDLKIANAREEGMAPWNYFDVEFPHTLRKGEVIDFEVEWELVDEMNVAFPFLSATIDVETKYLLLVVILPMELKPKRAYSYEFSNYVDVIPIETNEIFWEIENKSLRFRFEIPHPKKYHRYVIRWYKE